MIVKSILQWRERQSESFGERILQALKGPCGSSTPHSACVFHTGSNCSFVDSFHARRGNVTIKPKVLKCPDLGDGDPVHSHKWALFRCPSNCEMLALESWGR